MSIEALKLALEALEYIEHNYMSLPAPAEKAITAIREALAHPEQEPVATWENKYGMKEWQVHALRAGWSPTPPQRTWVGLTRAERFEIEKAMSKYYDYRHQCKTVCLPEFSAAIEAKLKEKNT